MMNGRNCDLTMKGNAHVSYYLKNARYSMHDTAAGKCAPNGKCAALITFDQL